MQLNFANLSNVQKLTLDNINVTLKNRLFQGVTNITHLVLRNLSWKRIEEDTFSGLSSLLSLTIERLNDLECMDDDILKPLLSLQSLRFRYVGATREILKYDDYARVFGGITSSNVHTLVLYAIHSSHHTESTINIDDVFKYGSVNTRLKNLDHGRNYITTFFGSPKRTLPVVEYISLSENAVIGTFYIQPFWLELMALSHLENLDISKMNTMLANICNDELFSLVVDNSNTIFLPIYLGQRLESVSVANTIYTLRGNHPLFHFSFFDNYNVLKYVDMSNARSITQITYNVGNIHALEYFNLQNVNVLGINTDLFNKMPNLTVLLLGKNDIGSAICYDKDNHIFSNNNKLRVLDLARCHLTEIPLNEFSSLQQLQNLNLSGNSLHQFHVELRRLRALRLLNLSHNKLTTLSVATRTELDNLEIEVDLSGNPLDSRCKNMEFITWTQISQVKFLNKGDTFCDNGNTTWNLFFDALET